MNTSNKWYRAPYRLLVWAILGLVHLGIPLFAQQNAESRQLLDKFSRYQHYTMEQGLSSNWVTSIAQDEDGFLWLGTVEGLNRFDGERFTTFFSRKDRKGLSDDRITKIIMLSNHRLLIGTEKGLCVLDTRLLEFQQITLPPAPAAANPGQPCIWRMYLATDHRVWVSAGNLVVWLDEALKIQNVYSIPAPEGESDFYHHVVEFLELPNGQVAMELSDQTQDNAHPWLVIDFDDKQLQPVSTKIPAFEDLNSIAQGNVTASPDKKCIWYKPSKKYWPATLCRFDWETRQTTVLLNNLYKNPVEKGKGEYNAPYLLPDSLIFLQRHFGSPVLYDLKNGNLTDLPFWKTSLPDGKTIVNFLDRDGNLWLSPRSEGVYFLTLKSLPASPMSALNDMHRKEMAKNGVSEEWFGFICTENAGKWVVSSGNGGLYSMDKKSRGVMGEIKGNQFQSFAYVSNFAPENGDTIWTNTLGGLCWYDAAANIAGPLKSKFKGLDSLDNRFLYRDHYGLIWGRVRNNGICCFDTRNRKFYHFPNKGKEAVFPLVSATSCSEGPDGDMWFCYGNESRFLARYHRKSGRFETVEPVCPEGVDCAKAFGLLADKAGMLWMFVDGRWYRMDIQSRQVQAFGKENGLVTNNPQGLCMDRDGNLWFASSNGLSRYDERNNQLRTFYQTDGLLSNVIINVELIDTARNILFVSTDKGLCLFEPDKIVASAGAPPTFITGIRVSDKPVSFARTGRLELLYDENDVRIEFTGVNFTNGFTNRYQYSMEKEGAPPNWKEAGTDNFANFLNLPPGHYHFQARAANSDGIWGREDAILSIVIHPPWWETWTFRVTLMCCLGLLAWVFYRRQIERTENREKEKAQVRQQLADLEMKALRSQMNPHFVFNALNSVQNFILKNETREASRYLTKFARLMRLILENSESPMVPLAREIELLRYYTELEQLRFNHRFAFDFIIDENLNAESVSIPGMLIQPHIENAIWHGLMHKTDTGHLWVRFRKLDEKTLLCEIEDDGVGRMRAAEIEKDRPKNHRSTGLANIRHRLDLLNAQLAEDIRLDFEDLYDEREKALGTRVSVRMPMHRSTSPE